MEEQCKAGRQVIIVGDESHPEVQGIKGWGNESTKVIESLSDFEKLGILEGSRLCFVAQTTFNYNKFQYLF